MIQSLYKPGDEVMFGNTWYEIQSVIKTNKDIYIYQIKNYGFILNEKELIERIQKDKKKPVKYRQMKLF